MSAPDRIYLQWGESYPGSTDPDADNVTWCPDRVEDSDVPYVRESILDAANRQYEELEAKVERLSSHLSVLDGSACAEEQAAGNGPCGVCKNCLRARIPDPDDLRDVCELVELHDYDFGLEQAIVRLRATLEGTE